MERRGYTHLLLPFLCVRNLFFPLHFVSLQYFSCYCYYSSHASAIPVISVLHYLRVLFSIGLEDLLDVISLFHGTDADPFALFFYFFFYKRTFSLFFSILFPSYCAIHVPFLLHYETQPLYLHYPSVSSCMEKYHNYFPVLLYQNYFTDILFPLPLS